MIDAKTFLKTVTSRPGVYQMFDRHGKIIYVGKAKNLKKRLSSYFSKTQKDPKTLILIHQIEEIKTIVTQSEQEALILEFNLIKKHHPRYNISLRDDKSYPYLFLSKGQYPRLVYHRGARKEEGRYFGPYTDASAVHEILNMIQKLFLIRSCKDSFFASRSRPCLQYQIRRCSAPCVNYISEADYQNDIEHAVMFLEGKNETVIDELQTQIEVAAQKLEYEQAAKYRDQIQSIRAIQAKQYVKSKNGNIDVLALVEDLGVVCISLLTIRNGSLLGNKIFFPDIPTSFDHHEILEAFLSQYYLSDQHEVPKEILLNQKIDDSKLLETVFSEKAERQVEIKFHVRGERAQWMKMAEINAREALQTHHLKKSNLYERYVSLQKALKLKKIPERLECFDISHTRGEATVASCVVFDLNGPNKSLYRRFNISGITPGDDFAAIRQALKRRFKDAKDLPDVLFIDGGKGQLKQAQEILAEYTIESICIVGIAKGVSRKPGLETIFISGQPEPLEMDSRSPGFHLMQQIRDESHRFAITGHRKRREKTRQTSVLENIEGIGSKRRLELLKFFGGIQGLLKASVADIAKVPGISQKMAQKIYEALHRAK